MRNRYLPSIAGLCLFATVAMNIQPASADYARHFAHEEGRAVRNQARAVGDVATLRFGRAAHHESRVVRDEGRAAFGTHHHHDW